MADRTPLEIWESLTPAQRYDVDCLADVYADGEILDEPDDAARAAACEEWEWALRLGLVAVPAGDSRLIVTPLGCAVAAAGLEVSRG